ncbi:MAG: hypothetical protein M3460_28685 [Actinomycetota bacterium]|nr:hypothetical protein [Actinomycetota bacterium]
MSKSGLACDVRGPVRAALLNVASHYHQFAGWMYQDTADTVGALRHYDAAMEAAQVINDADMVTAVLSLKSHLAWSMGDAARAIGLAQAGQREPRRVSDVVLVLIAQQEARGHALDSEADAVPLLTTAFDGLAKSYKRDRPRYATQLALALAGSPGSRRRPGAGDARRRAGRADRLGTGHPALRRGTLATMVHYGLEHQHAPEGSIRRSM